MLRPAYAVEYDYLPAHQCDPSLQTKRVAGLFFSGQLNGTTGADATAPRHDDHGASVLLAGGIAFAVSFVNVCNSRTMGSLPAPVIMIVRRRQV
jgi:Glucose inhibited division protein A